MKPGDRIEMVRTRAIPLPLGNLKLSDHHIGNGVDDYIFVNIQTRGNGEFRLYIDSNCHYILKSVT